MQVPTELLEACKRGDPGAFDELVRTTHRPVYSLVYRIVGNPDDAADVTQDVYLRVWRALPRFREEANAATWLYRIATNTALTYIRRRARAGNPVDPAHIPDVAAPDDATDRLGDEQVLERALATLSPEQRTVVVLKDVYGWTADEIGREVGATEGAVKVRLFRARQRLADHLAGQGVVVPMRKRKRSS